MRSVCELIQVSKKRKFHFNLLVILFTIIILIQIPTATPIYAASSIYYVAKNGADNNPGTAEQPWLTIQKAANTIVAGDIVYIKAGTYIEKITPKNSGKSGSIITYQNYVNDTVIINGTGINSGGTGLFNIQNKSYITLKGLEIKNSDYTGIWILGTADHITLQDLTVHNTVNAGLYAIGNLTITNITIDNCIFYNTNSTASNEMVTLSGANGFEIKNCTVYEPLTPRIGIDLKHGCTNGSVHDNEIYGCNSNPGIYIDARNDDSSNIDIYNNITHDNAYGIDLSDENGDATLSDINIYNNLIYNNYLCGFILPLGYGNETYNFTFINNTLYGNATSSNSEIKIIPSSSFLSSCVIRNNIIHGTKSGIYAIYYPDYANGGITIDHNLFYNSAGSFSSGSKQGTNAITENPLFSNVGTYDFHILTGSPVKDVGSTTYAPDTDYDSNTRPQGSGYDIGAYEITTANTAPVLATIGNKSAKEGETLSFTVSATDTNGDNLTYSAANLPSGAVFTSSTHTFAWTPTSGQAGEYTGVHFAVSDSSLSDSEDITITVNATTSTNTAPVLAAIGNKSVNEGATLNFTLSATDADGNTLTYSASNLPSGATFTPSTRTFSWTPTYDQAGSYTAVLFTVSDGTATDSESITITVNNMNRAPVLAAIGNKSVNEGATLNFTLSATDADGNTLTYSASNLPSGATFTPSTRTFTWTPTYDQAGSYTAVLFTVSDGTATDSGSITITVNNVNRAPILAAIGNKSVNEGATLNFTLSATDADGNTLTYSASNLPSGATFTPSTRTFTWTPTYSQAGSYTAVLFTVSDGTATDSESITITVNNVNRAPILAAIGNKSVNEGATLNFTLSATDADGNTLTYSASNLPSGATFTPSTRTFSWTPTYDQAGSYTAVLFTVSDGTATDSGSITITVNNVNRAPILAAIGNKSVNEGTTLSFTLSATDADGNALTYSASNLPSGAAFNSSTQTFSWTPTIGQAGDYANVSFEVSDGNLEDSEDITITVTSEEVSTTITSGGGGGVTGSSNDLTIPVELEGFSSNENIELNLLGQTEEQEILTDESRNCIIDISSGTYLLDATGEPVESLSISTPDLIPQPPEGKIIANIFQFGPSGTRFNPGIKLIATYDPKTLPDGTSPDELCLALWNGSTWQILESQVDALNNTISVELVHFSIYAVLSPTPVVISEKQTQTTTTDTEQQIVQTQDKVTTTDNSPEINSDNILVSQLEISPPEVEVNQSVTITALVTNYGVTQATYDIVIKINDNLLETKTLQIDGNSSNELVFITSFDDPGTYNVQVNNLTSTIDVQQEQIEDMDSVNLDEVPMPDQADNNHPEKQVSLSLLLEILGGAFILTVVTGLVIIYLRRKIKMRYNQE
jgi:aspartyl/asparaginyl beta-hydroxylase (cupin superfamily)